MAARHVLTILAVDDLAASVRFYRQAFGFPVRAEVPVYVELALDDGRGLGLYRRESFGANTGIVPERVAPGGVAGAELYFNVDDMDEAVSRIERAGGRLLSPRAVRPWGDEAAYYADPDGYVVVVARPPEEGD